MENVKENRSMTMEEALRDPSLAHIHEGLRYLQRTPPKDVFPKKYEISMVGLAKEDAVKRFKKKPDTPLKKVVSKIINSFDDDLSADLILKMTQAIIEKWAELSAAVPIEREAVLA
jgi:hypothetical protein